MTTPYHSKTIEACEIKKLLSSNSILSLVCKLDKLNYLNNPILNKPITVKPRSIAGYKENFSVL